MRLWNTMQCEVSERWAVSRTPALFLLSMPALALILAAFVRMLDRGNWTWYWREDGPAEWIQFCMLLVATAFSALIARRLMTNQRLLAFLFLLLTAGLVFVAGEEISWGQSLLNYDTPAGLARVNYKAETSMHNISSLINAFDIGKLLIGIYGTFAAFGVLWLRKYWGAGSWEIIAPPFVLATSFLVVVVFRALRFTLLQDHVPVGFGEFEELCLYFGMMAFTWLVWRRLRASPLEPQSAQHQ